MRLTPTGATLIELIVVLALGGAVGALMLSMVVRQQRFHTGVSAVVEGKRSTRDAIELLARELRPIATSTAALAPHGSDIYAMSDSAIRFRAHLGSSVVCAIDVDRTTLTLPGITGPINQRLTSFIVLPRAGDSLFIFNRGTTPSRDDDTWHRFALAANVGGGFCPLRPIGLATNDAEGAFALSLALTTPVPATIDVGAPIRFFRPTAYSVYRTSVGDWALGISACVGGTCGVRQPISGPYRPTTSGSPKGIALEFLDTSGALTTTPSDVARIDVVARTRSSVPLDIAHIRGTRYHDSLTTSIAVRNRL
ncbi:MAG: hypothetical protein M3125_01755 [Gemmatimonadota bacterium]|nr:hypothetical protein [Gemmatimonadota bacterium]